MPGIIKLNNLSYSKQLCGLWQYPKLGGITRVQATVHRQKVAAHPGSGCAYYHSLASPGGGRALRITDPPWKKTLWIQESRPGAVSPIIAEPS